MTAEPTSQTDTNRLDVEKKRQSRGRSSDSRPLDDVANYAWITVDDQHRLAVAVIRALDDGATTEVITEAMHTTAAELPGMLGNYLPMCVEHGLEVDEQHPKPDTSGLTFARFARANSTRAARWHEDNPWSPSDWMTALVGEVGEAANIIKKLNRSRDGLVGNSESDAELYKALGKELADVVAYLFLLAEAVRVDLEVESVSKFDEVSIKHGFPERLGVEADTIKSTEAESLIWLTNTMKEQAEKLKGVETYLAMIETSPWWNGAHETYKHACRDLNMVRLWMEGELP